MARLVTTGFELDQVNDREWTAFTGTSTLNKTTVRSGTFSYGLSGMSSGTRRGVRWQWASSAGNGPFFQRFYFRYATLPTAENTIYGMTSTGAFTTQIVYITIDSGGLLRLYDEDGVIGSPSSALSAGLWYKIDVQIDRTAAAGSHVVEARLSNSVFATSSARNLSAGVISFMVGGNLLAEAQTQGNWFFDDFALNDSSGSVQNTYPGEGKVIHLRPNSAGDNSDWTNDYVNVSEVSPDDSNTITSSSTLDQIDDHNIFDPSSLGDTDTITLVHVTIRSRHSTATTGNQSRHLARIKASASGTVEESTAISTFASSGFVTNLIPSTSYNNFSTTLTLYDLPGASTSAYTKTALETTQIGYRLSTSNTAADEVTTVQLIVEYVPDTARIQITNVTSAQVDAASSLTFAHVTPASDSNRLLVVTTQTEDNVTAGDMNVTGITYNGVALTKIRSDNTGVGSNDRSEIWYLIAPSTGSNNVVVSYTGSIEGSVAQAISIANAAQSSQPDANNGSNGNSTNPSVSVTTVADDCLVIDSTAESGSTNTLAPDGSQQESAQEANAGQMIGVTSYKYAETASTVTLQYIKPSSLWAISAASFKQFVSLTPTDAFQSWRMLTGMGR